MRFVRPEVFLIAKTNVLDDGVKEWLEWLHVGKVTIEQFLERFKLDGDPLRKLNDIPTVPKTPAERLIELAGRRCYMSFEVGLNPNVTQIRKEISDYIKNILKSGHGSVLEHYSFTFAIEGVSRVFTGEMNRHRAGMAISEGSMRYIRYEDIPMVETLMLRITEEDSHDLIVKKSKTRSLFQRMFEADEVGYREFCEIWKEELAPDSKFAMKKHITSLGRRIIGMGVATGGVWTGNVRALRHLLAMRTSEAAEEEIFEVAVMMLKIMMKAEPVLFGDFSMDEKGFWGPEYVKV